MTDSENPPSLYTPLMATENKGRPLLILPDPPAQNQRKKPIPQQEERQAFAWDQAAKAPWDDPTLAPKAMELAARLRYAGEGRQRAHHTERVWRYRPYQGGEPVSMIDWRQSGRGREIIVREHEPILERDVYLWAKWQDMPSGLSNAVALILYTLAILLATKERQVGWLDADIPTTRTATQVDRLFTRAFDTPARSLSAPPEAPLYNGFLIWVMDLSHGWELSLNRAHLLAAQGNMGIILYSGNVDAQTTTLRATLPQNWPLIPLRTFASTDEAILFLLQEAIIATRAAK